MKKLYHHQRIWLVPVFAVSVAVLSTMFSYTDFGNLRYFNSVLFTLTWGAWMHDYMENRPTMYRRQRRLRLAFSTLLFSGMYASLDAALDNSGDPTVRVIITSISGGILLTSILFYPEDDMSIPEEKVFIWERWLYTMIHRNDKTAPLD